MNGKVEVVTQDNNTWEAHGKTFFDFKYQISGVVYVASHVTPEPKYAVGAEVWFTVTKDNGTYPDKIKFEQAPEDSGVIASSSFKKSEPQNFDTMILSYAKDLAVARINNGGYKHITADSIVKDYLTLKEGLEVTKIAEETKLIAVTESKEGFIKHEDGKQEPLQTEEDIPDWMRG